MAGRRVTIENGRGVELPGRLFVPQEPKGSAALFVHDYYAQGVLNEQYAKQAMDLGVTCLTFDLGGHGDHTDEDPSTLSVNDHLSDVIAAYDSLAEQGGVDPGRIGAAGMGYGGYLASLLSGTRAIESLLLRSPPLYPDALRDEPRAEYDDEEALPDAPEPDNPALMNLRGFTGKVVVVTAGNDESVPPAITDAYEAAAPKVETRELPGAGHCLDPGSQHVFRAMVLGWAIQL